jgi:hypothetical protein
MRMAQARASVSRCASFGCLSEACSTNHWHAQTGAPVMPEHAPVLQSRILGGGNGSTRSRTKAYLPNTHRTVRLYRICNHRPAQKQTHPLFYTIPASSRGPSPRYNNPPSHRRRIPFVGKAVSLKLVLLELGAVFFAAVSSAAPRQS